MGNLFDEEIFPVYRSHYGETILVSSHFDIGFDMTDSILEEDAPLVYKWPSI